jgi:hypothetical protein
MDALWLRVAPRFDHQISVRRRIAQNLIRPLPYLLSSPRGSCSLVGELRAPLRVPSMSMQASQWSGRVGVHIGQGGTLS